MTVKNIPNIISASRGLTAIALLIAAYGNPIFWIIYIWCGVSDMIDGPIARKMNASSRKGAIIDSIADLVFVIAAVVVFLPRLEITAWMWICMGVIAFTKVANMLSGIICHKEIVMLHTIANKLTGLFLFLLPIAINWVPLEIAGGIVIAVALFAAVQEGHFIRTGWAE